MKNLRYVCAQPANNYYTWQVEVLIHNFMENGVNPNNIDIVCAVNNGNTPAIWRRLADTYNYVRFFFYDDDRVNSPYISSVRPNILKKHFAKYPELTDEAIFYHDCDIAFTQKVDWSKFLEDDLWYLSDTRFYVGAEYIKSKKHGIYEEMCRIVGIDEAKPVEEELNSGGAQYIMKNVDAMYWEKVERDSDALYAFFLEHLKEHPESPDYHPIQKWTADMWAVLWNAWYFGHEVKVVSEMDFVWATEGIKKCEENVIYHNAGVTDKHKDKYFFKGAYVDKLPYDIEELENENLASAFYVREIRKTAKKSCLTPQSLNKKYEYTEDDLINMARSEELLSSDVIDEYPTKFQMARNVARDLWESAKKAGKRLPVIVSSEVAHERFLVCSECEYFTKEERCLKCGCYMTAKTNFAASSCPLKKWESI